MMVLRRKAGDAIWIGDDIRIVIQDVQHEKTVRIGIEAPADVPVHRLEIYQLIQAENQAAGGARVLSWLQGDTDAAEKQSDEQGG